MSLSAVMWTRVGLLAIFLLGACGGDESTTGPGGEATSGGEEGDGLSLALSTLDFS